MATTASVRGSRDKLTVGEVCEDLQIAQSTFYEWRTKGTGPRCIKLPNGQLRVRRSDLEAWLDTREGVRLSERRIISGFFGHAARLSSSMVAGS
jgi:predicted DNA-binding transcriptional regulator AlpA